MSALLDLVTGGVLFLSLATATGCVAARWIVLPTEGHGPTPEGARGWVARVGTGATAALLFALLLVALRQFLEFRDPFAPWQDDARLLLTGTSWGTTWSWALGLAVSALFGFAVAGRNRGTGWWAASAAVLALGAFPGLTGHANAGTHRALTLPADVLHVWAVGGWIGTLAVVLLMEARHRRGDPGDGAPSSLLPELVPRFSPLAVACVATLMVTGLAGSWVHLDGVSELWTSSYGRLLSLKLGLVLGVLALGGWNWRRLTPRMSDPGGSDALRRAATLEFVLANVVLAVTALLVRTSPL